MALLNIEKDSVLRHLDYPIVGLYQVAPGGGSFAYGNLGHRYFSVMSTLMYRLNQLAPAEECRLAGRAYGAIGFTGNGPVAGDAVTVALSGGTLAQVVSKTVVVPATPGFGYVQLAGQFAQAFALDQVFQAAGFLTIADYGSQPFSAQKVSVPITSFIAPAGVTDFRISTSAIGQTPAQVLAPGQLLSPYFDHRERGQSIRLNGFLPILDHLENLWLGSSGQMSVNQTDNVKFRHDEDEQRQKLYDAWRQRLATFIGVPLNPDNRAAGQQGGMQVSI